MTSDDLVERGMVVDDETEELVRRRSRVLRWLKRAMLGVLVLTGFVVSYTAHEYTQEQERRRFRQSFHEASTTMVHCFYERQANKIWVALLVSSNMDAVAAAYHLSDRSIVGYAPFLETTTSNAREEWEREYGTIYFLNPEPVPDNNTSDVLVAPIQWIGPSPSLDHLVGYNLLSSNALKNAALAARNHHLALYSRILEEPLARSFRPESVSPQGLAFMPVLDQNNKTVLGLLFLEFEWTSIFARILLDHYTNNPIFVVLESECDTSHTFWIQGSSASYLGPGDWHDAAYDDLVAQSSLEGFLTFWNANADYSPHFLTFLQESAATVSAMAAAFGLCPYTIQVYPSHAYAKAFRSNAPILYTVASVLVFTFTAVLFCIYDVCVERRQHLVMDTAVRSNAIVRSLFPLRDMRERLFGQQQQQQQQRQHRQQGRLHSILYSLRHSQELRTSNQWRRNDELHHSTLAPKARLSNFLVDTELEVEYSSEEPIAEMFSNTTVMFADIAGFTAWSSEREPYQVFKLLETLYRAFDIMAKKLGVFKVETIGDCYVAVTGLPQPSEDHAVTMARFAHECLNQMRVLTKQLDLLLGPGTSDLALRIGMHSGAVTAGVLRGEKSRFQLFGDTINTASRMESTGERNRIQCSQATADLIIYDKKAHWVTQRDGVVTAKGKGEMQTYWIQPCKKILAPQPRAATPSTLPDHEDTESIDDITAMIVRESNLWGNLNADEISMGSRMSFDVKTDRLVDWTVEVLLGLLEKVVVAHTRRREPRPVLPDNYNTNVLGEVAEVIAFPPFGTQRVPSNKDLANKLPFEVRVQLREYVANIASLYRDVPFHNFEHASHVTMSAHKLIKRINTVDDAFFVTKSRRRDLVKEISHDLHQATFGISSDPLAHFAVVFSALIHDVDHTGVPNAQLIREKSPIAVRYHNKSVAEQNSVVVAWEMLMESRYEALRTCIFPTQESKRRFRQLVVNAVMATDVLDQELLAARKCRWDKAFIQQDDMNRKATIVIEHIIQASDVAHTMQHWHVFTKWNKRLFDECHDAHLRNRAPNPLPGWYEGQVSFFDNYVIPLARKLQECGVFGVSGEECLSYALENRDEWAVKGAQICREMALSCGMDPETIPEE